MTCRLLVISLAVFVGSPAPVHLLGGEPPPEELLRRVKGLVRLGRSDVWVVRDEQRLQTRLQSFAALKQTIQTSQSDLATLIARNRMGWLQLSQVEAAARALPNSLAPNAPQRRQLEQQRNSLRQKFAAPRQLGGVPAVQAKLIESINARNDLGLSILWARETIPKLVVRYEQLNRDEQTLDALRKLGGAHRLGPVLNFQRVSRTLRQHEQLAFTSTIPLYRQNGQLRLSGIINDDTPVTFSWRESDKRTVITTNMAQSAGIEVAADAPRAELDFSNRRLLADRVRIPYLRFGNHEFREVDAFVLPPEAEQLGAQLGRDVFRDVQFKVQPELLCVKLGAVD